MTTGFFDSIGHFRTHALQQNSIAWSAGFPLRVVLGLRERDFARLPAETIPACRPRKKANLGLPLPGQGLTLSVRYDRKEPAKPPPRLCPRAGIEWAP